MSTYFCAKKHMRSFAIVLLVLLSCNSGDKKPKDPLPAQASRHSTSFNGHMDSAMQAYYRLTEAFVNWDSTGVIRESVQLSQRFSGISLDDVKNDPEATRKANLALFSMTDQLLDLQGSSKDMTTKRQRLNTLTQSLYGFLEAVRYDEKKLYLQECPMAFNDEDAGLWLSEQDSIRNPYLGLHHPRYGKAMINCGSNKSTLDYTTKK